MQLEKVEHPWPGVGASAGIGGDGSAEDERTFHPPIPSSYYRNEVKGFSGSGQGGCEAVQGRDVWPRHRGPWTSKRRGNDTAGTRVSRRRAAHRHRAPAVGKRISTVFLDAARCGASGVDASARGPLRHGFVSG